MTKKLSPKQITEARAALLAELAERHTLTFTKSENYAYWFVSCDLDREHLIVREPVGKHLGNVIFSVSLPVAGMVW
jgi:hypothetical protein